MIHKKFIIFQYPLKFLKFSLQITYLKFHLTLNLFEQKKNHNQQRLIKNIN